MSEARELALRRPAWQRWRVRQTRAPRENCRLGLSGSERGRRLSAELILAAIASGGSTPGRSHGFGPMRYLARATTTTPRALGSEYDRRRRAVGRTACAGEGRARFAAGGF